MELLFVPDFQYFESKLTDINNFNLTGSGRAYALCNERFYKIGWSRPSPESVIGLVLPDGNNYPLKQGKVWFEVLATTPAYKIENNA